MSCSTSRTTEPLVSASANNGYTALSQPISERTAEEIIDEGKDILVEALESDVDGAGPVLLSQGENGCAGYFFRGCFSVPKASKSGALSLEAVDRKPADLLSPTSSVDSMVSNDMVQFASPAFYCSESQSKAVVEVMRFGAALSSCSIKITTVDGSAKAGRKYVPYEGVIRFGPGDFLKTVEVSLIQDDHFDTTLQFGLQLSEASRCTIGAYLGTTRVLVHDDDMFPSNDLSEPIQEYLDGELEALTSKTISLLISFMRFAFSNVPTIWWKTLATAALDQLPNAYYYVVIVTRVYLVDMVLNTKDPQTADHLLLPGRRQETALILALIYAFPHFIILCMERLQVGFLDMRNELESYLKVNLFRKYLNYKPDSMELVPVQELVTVMNADIPLIVEEGYMFVFSCLQGIGKIVVVAIFMICRQGRMAIPPLVLFPMVMLIWIRARQARDVELEGEAEDCQQNSTGMYVDAAENFEMIRDYSHRQALAVKFDSLLQHSFPKFTELRIFKFFNERIMEGVSVLVISIMMVVGAEMVLSGAMTLGSFLALLQIYQEMGTRFQNLYNSIQAGVQAGHPLIQLTKMMNLPTDILDRLEKNQRHREFLAQHVQEAAVAAQQHAGAKQPACIFDDIPIRLDNLTIEHVPQVVDLTLDLKLGRIVYVKGDHGSGKASLLRVIAGVEEPDEGRILHSSHNRCLHVTKHAQIQKGLTLYENLTYGSKNPEPHRVVKIFRRLRLDKQPWLYDLLERDVHHQGEDEESDTLVRMPSMGSINLGAGSSHALELTSDGDFDKLPTDRDSLWQRRAHERRLKRRFGKDTPWHQRLSSNELQRLHLCRAFIYNPEVMVLHRPTDGVDSDFIEVLLELFQEFVEHRGIAEPHHRHRMPRTLIFSGGTLAPSEDERHINIADEVWTLGERQPAAKDCDDKFGQDAVDEQTASGFLVSPGRRQQNVKLSARSIETSFP